MPIVQLPLMKGTGKSYRSADYVDLLPVNMLATPKEVLNSNGYLRSFPGVKKRNDVAGFSRGAIFNSQQGVVYRVCGSKLYRNEQVIASIGGLSRVSMAASYTSHAVCAEGTVRLFRYDGAIKDISNWPADSGYTQYDLGNAQEVCRNRSRYIWSKEGSDSFFISDLEDESKPDRYSAQYRAESQPDGIIGIDDWRDFVICFGAKTTEYFSLTGNSSAVGSALYQAQPSMMVTKGIAGTYCKTKFLEAHAIISHPATGAPSVYVISAGEVQQIATSHIEKILQSYPAGELALGVMEAVRFESHELLIIHLPRHVLVYDGSASQSAPQWSVLKGGLFDSVHPGIDFMYEGNAITCGDKATGRIGELNTSTSELYGASQEHILYTPLYKSDNARAFDFELEASTGVAQIADRLFISATTDGINYGKEMLIEQNSPFDYDRRILWRRIGRIRKNIGFKIRIVTKSPVTLSGAQIRLE
ncbi:packaged DNA stabilization protein gp10 [Franconibacter sp. IITDAS19]|uniref:packaged DNA stabilization protein n=1 Tax=Franconibacter sp. IITDAS19 TaxID=2930569 RepID=UPI001FF9D137|nr:packaged DNA stabilization protein [Franconibacter sp. IITDAS19]MCK1966869.1 packaged DNA stabilization protein gp10 [Franconibacter sp. IITDAS19]